ncbi:methionyl-tRNA formyltransferase [Bradyrhizobium sp. NAS80.1]|uniref:methionyl-tRNA formyltransferase n=1 Tax=Bradyrhizobium sp. NAS80.1 TaxID=1680159 RepID=UPI00096406CF|nr:methionyl-tRNA formyltransferase [Bradyrhizobium sp. NAS80.1]OKO71208.1 methionyl-tRNA formyltransferase [Bradyrhizobium sp. NAS80.1]
MAMIGRFVERQMERNSIHDTIEARYSIFERDGRSFLQIDTYGRQSREMPEKKSQSIQLDRESGLELLKILKRAFHAD